MSAAYLGSERAYKHEGPVSHKIIGCSNHGVLDSDGDHSAGKLQ